MNVIELSQVKKDYPMGATTVHAVRGIDLTISTDGEAESVSGRFLFAVVSNVHLFAGGLANLSPNALVNDGLMDLWLFEGESLRDTLRCAWDLWLGKHVYSKYAHCFSIRRVMIESESSMLLQLDGEPLVEESKITIEVFPRALNVLVPKDASCSLFIDP